ncbi:MAG: ATP-dependent helicase, partial [Comamonas sp.]|nr:ATP-dependent helicase [Comamonas sp.]
MNATEIVQGQPAPALATAAPEESIQATETVEITQAAPTTDAVETPETAAPQAATPHPFVALGLDETLVRAVADLGDSQPTALQTNAIPIAMGS